MSVSEESLERVREIGRSRYGEPVGRMTAFEQGRNDMLECVANSRRLRTETAIRDCDRKLRH